MKIYVLEIVIKEGCDEFWEDLKDKSGCDEVEAEIRQCLVDHGFVEPEALVRLKHFSQDEE